MEKDKDALAIIAEAYEKMKEEGCATYRGGKPNLAELSRRTGYGRKVVARLYSNGFKERPHGNSGSKGSHVINPSLEEEAKRLLASGVSNSSVVFSRLREKGYEGGLTTVKGFIRANSALIPAGRQLVQKPQGKVRRYKSNPGDMFQMDWGFVNVVDMLGNNWRCACFALVCHHCGMRYIEFFPNARQENLFIGMIHGFAYMGLPKLILTDNMASVSNRRDAAGRPVFNGNYDEFQHMMGIDTVLCKPRHPWTKGAVERLVRFVKDNFIQGRTFINISDLNMQALIWCHKENSRLQKGLGAVPVNEHAAEPLGMLPDDKSLLLPYLAPERSIGMDGFVYYEGRRYGVPFSYRGKKVRVLRDKNELEILHPETYEILESHAVDWSYRPHYSPSQFEPIQPEEQPTMPVASTIAIADGQDDDWFRRYDF